MQAIESPALGDWRHHCAVELGDVASLATLREPAARQGDPGLRSRWTWTRVLYGRGEFAAVAETAAKVQKLAAKVGDKSLAFEAALLSARALRNLGRAEAAIDVLEHVAAPTDADQARQAMLTAVCYADLGEANKSLATITRVRTTLDKTHGRAKLEAGFWMVTALYRLGRLREATRILDELKGEVGERALCLELGRMLVQLEASVALESGDLGRAEALLLRLAPQADAAASLLRPYIISGRVALRLGRGDLAGIDDEVARLATDGARLGPEHDVSQSARIFSLRLALLRGQDTTEVKAVALPGADRPFFERLLALTYLRYRLHHGDRRLKLPDPATCRDKVELFVTAELIHALAAVLAGDASSAAAAATRAIDEAHERGFGLLEAEALASRCDALVCARSRDELGRAAPTLAGLAERLGSPRFQADAELYLLGCARVPDPAALERLAGLSDATPVTARRAQALLGGAPTLDAVDRLVVDALRAEPAWAKLETLEVDSTTPWQPGWGIDIARGEIWRSDGTRASFGKEAVLWRILTTLVDKRGEASKEALVLAVWSAEEYHPLKHDNRLRLAVRKLRQSIEPDPKAPTRLLTTADGYLLAPGTRVLGRP